MTVPWSKDELAALSECRQLLWNNFGPQSNTDKLQLVLGVCREYGITIFTLLFEVH